MDSGIEEPESEQGDKADEAYGRACQEVVVAIREQLYLAPETVEILIAAEDTLESTKRLLMGLKACGIADIEPLFEAHDLRGR